MDVYFDWRWWLIIEKYNTIWDKVNADIKKEFDSKPVYNKEFLKTKLKSHGDEVTDFYDQIRLKLSWIPLLRNMTVIIHKCF